MRPSVTPSHSSVFCARLTRGWRKAGTALAIASTPVSAEQPEANARSSSSTPTDSATCGRCDGGATTRLARIRPPMITAAIAAMKASVGAMNSRADSPTPHRLTAGDQGQHDRQIGTGGAVQTGEGRGQRRDSGGDADGRVQHVVDDQRRGGDQARHPAQVRAGHRVRAAAAGKGGDDLPVGDHEHAEQDDDRVGHRQRVGEPGGPGGHQDDDDRLGAVGHRRQRVERQRGQARQGGQPVPLIPFIGAHDRQSRAGRE